MLLFQEGSGDLRTPPRPDDLAVVGEAVSVLPGLSGVHACWAPGNLMGKNLTYSQLSLRFTIQVHSIKRRPDQKKFGWTDQHPKVIHI